MDFKYSASVTKGLKQRLSKEIINSAESSPVLRKEIRRVFQMANRRIQNIEKSGVLSPAVQALGKLDNTYSKFSVSKFGNGSDDWKSLKKEYSKAITFLNQPTSTASGAKQFSKQLQTQLGLSNDDFKEMEEIIIKGYNTMDSELSAKIPYAEYIQDIYDRAIASSASQIEKDSKKIADEIQKQINLESEKLSSNVMLQLENFVDGFNIKL